MDSQSFLNNPMAIQHRILTDYEKRIDGETPVVVDPNNTFSFLLEAFGRTVAEAQNAVDAKLNVLYPKRATTTKDLYHHLSDYDYVGFYSSPAPLRMRLMLHKTFIINNAVPIPGTNFSLAVIPADTKFTVGRFELGLYYPIHIRVNNVTKTISAVYDTTKVNPLHSLDNYSILVQDTSFGGIDMIALEFDTYQFTKHVFTESVKPELGFNKKYKHPNRFYAIRVKDVKTGKELAYSMSVRTYDPQRPTVRLQVYPEEQSIAISVPQIYLNEGKVSNQLRVEIFTSLGALDTSLAHLNLEDIQANFALDSPDTDLQYTEFLKNIPTLILAPAETRLIGGSNGDSFTQMKEHVIYRSGDVKVPITRMELEKFFQYRGFDTFKIKVDNLTDRRYYVYRPIRFDDQLLSTVDGRLTLSYDEASLNQHIVRHPDRTMTILPTTMYRYMRRTQTLIPLDDATQDSLNTASPTQLVDILNQNDYFVNPHHHSIEVGERYVYCVPYDLLTTKVDQMLFEEENNHISVQINVTSTDLKHLGSGSKGYLLRIGVQRSADIAEVPIEDLNIFLTLEAVGGQLLGTRGTYLGFYDGLEVFDFQLETDYRLTDDQIMLTNMLRRNIQTGESLVRLIGKMSISTFIRRSHLPDAPQNHRIYNNLIDPSAAEWLAVSLQTCHYQLGTNLRDVIDTNLLTTWRGREHQRHPVDVPLLYDHDVYETNEDGSLKYTIDQNTGEVLLNKLHVAGDPHLDSETGHPLIKHRAGDLVLDVQGNPIITHARLNEFTIDLSGFSYQHRLTIPEFLPKIAQELQSYYTAVRAMNQQILENTSVSFRPITTSGETSFKLNNLTNFQMNLELSFRFVVFIPQTVIEDAKLIEVLRRSVERIIRTQVGEPLISTSVIMHRIREELDEFVSSVDFVSLNGHQDIQTLANLDENKLVRLGERLALTQDGHITSQSQLTIDFKPFDA